MKQCQSCGRAVQDGAIKCPYCAGVLGGVETGTTKGSPVGWVMASLACSLLALLKPIMGVVSILFGYKAYQYNKGVGKFMMIIGAIIWIGGWLLRLGLLTSNLSLGSGQPYSGQNGVSPPIATHRPTIRPTKTHIPGATQVPIKSVIQSTPEAEDQAPSGCTLWSNVSLADVGKTMCVYGTFKNTAIRDGVLYLTFSNNPEDFYFVHYGSGWWEDAQNTCHLSKGKIEQLGKSPVMVIDDYDLYYCK